VAKSQKESLRTPSLRSVMTLSLMVAVCSLMYELLIAKTLIMLTGQTVRWMSITVGLYVAALGLGTFTFEKMKHRLLAHRKKSEIWRQNVTATLFRVECWLAFLGAICVVCAIAIHMLYRIKYFQTPEGLSIFYATGVRPLTITIIICQAITVLIGFFSGFEVPLLVELAGTDESGDRTHLVLGSNYLGNLVGTLLFSLVLLPWLDVLYTSVVVASLNLAICIYLLSARVVRPTVRRWAALIAVALVLGGVALSQTSFYQAHLKVFYYSQWERPALYNMRRYLGKRRDVKRIKTLYQNIDIVRYPGSRTDRRTVYLDGHFQFDSKTQSLYHEAMAHIPIQMYQTVPRRILVLGGGDGLLTNQLLRYGDRIESITQIELDPRMAELAKHDPFFSALNERALHNPKVNLVLEDGFYFLRNTKQRFDAIFIDFPYPYNYDLSRLYSREFYRYAADRLEDDGFLIIDCYISRHRKEFNNVIISTVAAGGFKQIIPFEDPSAWETFIAASKKKRAISRRVVDFGVAYQHIDTDSFRRVQDVVYPHDVDGRFVNSIFSPKLMMMYDYFF